jgi:HAMP domain-containing protein
MPILKDAEALPTSGPPTNGSGGAGAPMVAPGVQALREALDLVLWDQRQFEELLVIDTEGRVVASTHQEHEGHNAEALQYFRDGLRATTVTPVFLSPITEKLTMIVATPIRLQGQGVRGVLAARLNLQRFFSVLGEVTGLGESGETVVGHRDDRRVVFMAPTRHDPGAALRRAIVMGGRESRSLQAAVDGGRGAGRSLDYRGVESLAAWAPVPSLRWGLVVKIDRAEALRPAVRAGLRALMLMLPLIAGIVWVSLLASRALVQPLCDLREAADRISRGDFDVQVDVRSRDEVGALADSFDRMVAAIKFFRAHSRPEEDEEYEEYEEEMAE